MVLNFEEITEELTAEELKLVPNIVKHLKLKVGKDNAITSTEVVKRYKESNIPMTGARWRKIIHHIRINGLIPLLISTSKGYYVASTENEAKDYLTSLKQRISSMTMVYDSLEHQLRTNK